MPPKVIIVRPNLTEEEREKNIQGIIDAANIIAKDYGYKITGLRKISEAD